MSLVKYITQTPQDFGQALQVSGFALQSESKHIPFTENLANNGSQLFTGGSGIANGTLVSSGEFSATNPSISWQLYNPVNNKVYSRRRFGRTKLF